uniref:histidine kinase n=1 Tax=Cyanothece sp. (strain PCC 7425 / ATCC 29141) TaxID=395961 RepID=B8HKS5_CYAP4
MTAKLQNILSEIVFVGSSEMAGLMRSHDWTKTQLGPIDTWSPSLKTAVQIMLGSRYPMVIWWGEELINLYNDAYIPMLGQRHPAALGQSAIEIWAEVWEVLGPQAESVLREGQSSWNQELLLMMERNGYLEETYFTFSYSPIAEEGSATRGVFCAVTEETERVLGDRRMRTLLELTTTAVRATTLAETCRICTDVLGHNAHDLPFACIYLFDHQQQPQLVGSTLAAILNPDPLAIPAEDGLEAEQAAHHLHQWVLEQKSWPEQRTVIDNLVGKFGALPGGAWTQPPHQAVILPLLRFGQHPLGLLLVGVNPHRRLNQADQAFFDLVAGQVTTAIANALAYEEERHRAEALAELDRAKTAFFSNVSHEFRTPLTLMLGPAADALADQEDPLSPGQQQRIELIQRNGLRLLKLVNTLLDFSQIESDRLQAVYEPTDLATFTAELASVFRAAIEQAGLRFVVDCSPLPEPVYIDREMWEKIVLNLLSNAFKFTFSGEITVRLQQRGEQVELAIQDTGIGIPVTEMPRLFERFHRVKGAQGRTFEGSGIGLSLVQELVKLHGGTVQVDSVEGSGSCFRVSIPTGSSHLPAEQIGTTRSLTSTPLGPAPYIEEVLRCLPQENGQLERPTRQPASKVPFVPPELPPRSSSLSRILLVDDNADMRDYVGRLLSERWQVETAANGAIALERLQQDLPDLVLTDVMMPEMDGFQLLQVLRSDPLTQSIPVILLSARAGEVATIAGLAAGADDYLIKPFSARELIARVETQLQMSRLRQEESANRFKTEFLLTVTHELQAPLATILGWARLLQAKSFNPDTTTQALAAIERNATIQAKLVKDLLDISSLLSGNLRLKAQLFDLVALVQNAMAKFRPLAEAKGIDLAELSTNVASFPALIDGDRLRQVITNLLDNALKFTPAGGQVAIQLERQDAEVQITVTDTGIGIRPDFLPYIFDRFTQAESPSRYTPGGLGIGLAIARHLVELHHGTIIATSAGEGQGTTFTVRLPLGR